MEDKKYSLNDMFGFLREATLVLDRPVTVSSENTGEKEKQTKMLLSEFIAMSLANELVSEESRMASSETTASRSDVITALAANHYEEVVYPNYTHFGITMSGGRKRRTRRRN